MPSEKRSITLKVLYPNGERAPFTKVRLDTEVTKPNGERVRTQLAERADNSGEDTFTFRISLKDPKARLWLVLVDDGREESQLVVEGQHRYSFGQQSRNQQPRATAGPSKIVTILNTGGTVNVTNDDAGIVNMTNNSPGTGNGTGTKSAWEVLAEARKAVPAVDYALGVAGVAAAGSIVVGFLGNTRGALIVGGAMLIAMVMLFVFARLVASKNEATTRAGLALMWMVIGFVGIFMAFTVSAYAIRQPEPWAELLGIAKPRQAASSPLAPDPGKPRQAASCRPVERESTDGGTDWVQLATGMIRCYQGDPRFVQAIQEAACNKDAAKAEVIYRGCPIVGDRLKHANGATAQQWIVAVVHAAACYDPKSGINTPRIRNQGQVFESPFGPIVCTR